MGAKLGTTNEKLRREKEKFSNERDELKIMVKDRSRGEQGEDKKVGRLLLDMGEFLSEIPKLVGDDIMAPPKPGRTIPHTILDARAKESLATALKKIKDEKEVTASTEKSEKAQRELISAEREKRKIEDEKLRLEDKYGRLESELRQTTRERDRIKDECESVKQKNRDNLAQTQDGVKAFKEQIETLKKDLQDEKTKHRDTRKVTDEKARQFQTDMRTVKTELEEKSTAVSDLEFKVADLDEKWSKSKRIKK